MAKRPQENTPDRHAAVLAKEGDIVASGTFADVWLVGEAKSEYSALLSRKDANSRRAARQLPRYFERYANGQRLSDEHFKPQGKKKRGQWTMQVWEFKGFQYRIYGVVVDVDGKRAFIGTEPDPKKKDDKADASIVQRALDTYVRMFK